MRSERFAYYYYRSPKLDCGCHVPCRCEYRNNPSEKRIDAYADAIEYLAEQGLLAAALTPELRKLWQRGGDDRNAAEKIVRRWAA